MSDVSYYVALPFAFLANDGIAADEAIFNRSMIPATNDVMDTRLARHASR